MKAGYFGPLEPPFSIYKCNNTGIFVLKKTQKQTAASVIILLNLKIQIGNALVWNAPLSLAAPQEIIIYSNKMIVKKLTQYLHSDSRNKIVFIQENISGITCVDVGASLANRLLPEIDNKHISFIAERILNELLNNAINTVYPFGKVLCIKNLGILFEKELKLNFQLLLDKYSKDNALFVKWDGQIENNTLYFLSKEKGIEINIQGLSHIKL